MNHLLIACVLLVSSQLAAMDSASGRVVEKAKPQLTIVVPCNKTDVLADNNVHLRSVTDPDYLAKYAYCCGIAWRNLCEVLRQKGVTSPATQLARFLESSVERRPPTPKTPGCCTPIHDGMRWREQDDALRYP